MIRTGTQGTRGMQNEQINLQQLLRNAVEAVIKLATEKGLGTAIPTYEYTVVWYEKIDETRSEGREKTEEAPSFLHLSKLLGDQLLNDRSVCDFASAAAAFAKEHGKFALGFLANPERAAAAVLPLYFLRVGSLRVDEAELSNICAEYVRDLTEDVAVIETIFQATAFSADEPFNLSDEIRFRPVTHDDINHLGGVYFESTPFLNTPPPINSADWICEISRPGPKNTSAEFNRHYDLIELIAGTLNVTDGGGHCFVCEAITSRVLS